MFIFFEKIYLDSKRSVSFGVEFIFNDIRDIRNNVGCDFEKVREMLKISLEVN